MSTAAVAAETPPSPAVPACFHCGTPCRNGRFEQAEKIFCCHGCRTVFELLSRSGLDDFYKLSATAGVRVGETAAAKQFDFLDEPTVRARLVDFTDERISRITLTVPAIHCIACVWLLENLFRLKSGIRQTQVNFLRREVVVLFETPTVKLSEVVALLASLGYEPELKLSHLAAAPKRRTPPRLWIQLALAGFAFGNIMLFSLSDYFGLDAATGGGFRKLTSTMSLLLALPVVTFSALDYWRAAWTSIKQKLLNIDVPIAAGLAAIFIESCVEVFRGQGNGYFDSLCGLIFFLLCGKLFQQKTFDRLAFDRDYQSFFPLSVTRKNGATEETVALAQLVVGDRLLIRNGELIPADATLAAGPALVDYSFVTGEAEPVKRQPGEILYAGGRQMGGVIEIQTIKPVSQSRLASLWNQDTFRKDRQEMLNRTTNTYSRRFTKIIFTIAIGAGIFWAFKNPALSVKAFTSVLIVACPCALALAAPVALGTAQRVLARRGVFLKNPYVLETLAEVDAVVFDKTGTLTAAGAGNVTWRGAALNDQEKNQIWSLARQSTHPLAVRVAQFVAGAPGAESRSFREIPGCGVEAVVDGAEIWMGSATWLETRGVKPAAKIETDSTRSAVHVASGGNYRGVFELTGGLRPGVERAVREFSKDCELTLLSGDHAREQKIFSGVFGSDAELRFQQTPVDKLDFIRQLQARGRKVMMVGDGLNDAGALKQSDAGVAVVEDSGVLSPASDVILTAAMMPQLPAVRAYARRAVRVVRVAFVISSLYNLLGVSIAASGRLAPVVCAVLMPLSSVTVVAFASLAAAWTGRRLKSQS